MKLNIFQPYPMKNAYRQAYVYVYASLFPPSNTSKVLTLEAGSGTDKTLCGPQSCPEEGKTFLCAHILMEFLLVEGNLNYVS